MFTKKYSAVALLQLLSISGALAHPNGGVPRLMGRNGRIDIRDLAPLTGNLVKRVISPDGSCGGTNGYTCGTTENKCCSQYGWCGDSDLHCQPSENCQTAFGICTTTPVGTAGRCGTQGAGASCPTGQCCSEGGYCGTTADHCMSPLCQVGFGKCDADTTPSGASTSTVARTKPGTVLYGGDGVYDCVVPGTIALTYDDGPYIYTDAMLDMLNSYNAKATFFITGINNGKGAIDTTPAWNAVIKKMHAGGHQLASHTWSHADLSTLTEARRRDEMYKLEMAMRNIVGFFPTYMRPPYSSCNSACAATMADLGYHISYFDLDTDDYNNVTPALIPNAIANFDNKINPSSPTTDDWLVIAHDIHQQTATTLTAHMLQKLTEKGYRAVTMGECMGDPKENWYRGDVPVVSSSTSSSSTKTSSTTSSTKTSSTTSSTKTTTTSSTKTTTSSTKTSTSSTKTSTTTTKTSTTSTKTTTSATATSTACPATAPYKVGTWCATPIPTWTTTTACWTAVGNCWDQGDLCWTKADSTNCEKYQNTCVAMETYCQSCADAGKTTCAYKAPTYPTS